MKFFLLVSLLLIYFPLLYYYKTRIIRVTGSASKPDYMRWYEGADYVIKHTTDHAQRATLVSLRKQIRTIGLAGIFLFWFIVIFYP